MQQSNEGQGSVSRSTPPGGQDDAQSSVQTGFATTREPLGRRLTSPTLFPKMHEFGGRPAPTPAVVSSRRVDPREIKARAEKSEKGATHSWMTKWPAHDELSGRPVLLTPQMIEAGARLCARLPQWSSGVRALEALAQRFPTFDADAVLLKVVAVNAFCGPNVLSRQEAARHIERVMRKVDASVAGAEVVETLADIPTGARSGSTRRQHSFASKFAHAFIHADRFPVLDTTTSRMLRMHLGPRSWIPREEQKYVEFEANFRRLRGLCGYEGKRRDLSRYLWISGQVLEFCRNRRARINPELKTLLNSGDAEVASDLIALAPNPGVGTPWL